LIRFEHLFAQIRPAKNTLSERCDRRSLASKA
jgi:hypothetical protein